MGRVQNDSQLRPTASNGEGMFLSSNPKRMILFLPRPLPCQNSGENPSGLALARKRRGPIRWVKGLDLREPRR